jgi:hypothetical protein
MNYPPAKASGFPLELGSEFLSGGPRPEDLYEINKKIKTDI